MRGYVKKVGKWTLFLGRFHIFFCFRTISRSASRDRRRGPPAPRATTTTPGPRGSSPSGSPSSPQSFTGSSNRYSIVTCGLWLKALSNTRPFLPLRISDLKATIIFIGSNNILLRFVLIFAFAECTLPSRPHC